jgi:hypothetical protein
MKFVAIYRLGTGEISALCALPPDAGPLSVGMQMGPGEGRAEFEVPQELSVQYGDPDLHTRMDQIMKEYRLDGAGDVKIAKKSGRS